MTNYNISFGFDGHTFVEVIEAENAEQAFAYLCWICGEDYTLIQASETDDIPSYYCPAKWQRPESVEQARKRSLITALERAGINYDKWSPALDNFMKKIGYTKELNNGTDVFGFSEKTVTFRKPNAALLTVDMD